MGRWCMPKTLFGGKTGACVQGVDWTQLWRGCFLSNVSFLIGRSNIQKYVMEYPHGIYPFSVKIIQKSYFCMIAIEWVGGQK